MTRWSTSTSCRPAFPQSCGSGVQTEIESRPHLTRDSDGTKFGTFGGVFTPCTLTILGVIMFLRLGHVVGQAGVWAALLIVVMSKAITVLTSLSLSAIATNTRLKGGGAYYLISRSLGIEFGGAIGLVFFAAQAISVAMYVIGFSEAFVAIVPGAPSLTIVATIVNVIVFVSVYIGAGWTIKVQYFILATLVGSLVSFYLGAFDAFRLATLQANLGPQYVDGDNFFKMFSLFFPAVTGIMAGANLSGDLRDPARSIPTGTLAAVAVTGVVYGSMTLLLGSGTPREALIGDNLVVSSVARWSGLITAGIFAATLSSALGSMMGAPRILQAFARDNIIPLMQRFATGSGPSSEPRAATVLTFLIAQACILLADLNTIAPLITMFFMITYGLLNLATFYEAITKNPSYRPRFRFCHWTLSLAGALGCLSVMILIDWRWAGLSIFVMGLLYWYIRSREIEARWGDLKSGLLFERARRNLLKLQDQLHHPRNWRPIILSLSGTGWSRPRLAIYGHWLSAGHGILTLGQVIQGEVDDWFERRASQEALLQGLIRKENLEAFPAVVVAPTLSEGIESLVQCHGLGTLRPNTVLLGWPGDVNRVEIFGATLRTIAGLQRSIVSLRFTEDADDPWEPPRGTIDVWWRGHQNGELMLLLAHLLTLNVPWREHTIRLLRAIPNDAGKKETHEHLIALIDSSRIRATAHVIVAKDPREAIQQSSCEAAIVFLGFEAPAEGQEQSFVNSIEQWAGDLPRIVLVDSVGGMSLDT